MPDTRFPLDPELLAVAVNVKPEGLIAGQVLLTVPPVDKSTFKYLHYDTAQNFTVPDTKVGRRSEPDQVEFKGTEATGNIDDYGLDEFIPNKDDAEVSWDEKARSAQWLSSLVLLDKEVRVANMVSNINIYDADKRAIVAAGSKFTDVDADLIGMVSDYLDRPLLRPNKLIFNQDGWRHFRKHPQIVKAVHGNSGDAGMVTRQQVAELFEVKEVLVGMARINSAKPGQDANYQRAWGPNLIGIHEDPNADRERGATFGISVAQRVAGKTWFSGQIAEPKKGLHGGVTVRSGESVGEEIMAPSLGFMLKDVI